MKLRNGWYCTLIKGKASRRTDIKKAALRTLFLLLLTVISAAWMHLKNRAAALIKIGPSLLRTERVLQIPGNLVLGTHACRI